jgi:KDO2-lipid IV(A) lauroyltransferase
MFKYFVYKIGQFFVNRLPLELSYRLAVFLSDVHYWLSFRDRRAVINNLRVILPEEQDVSHQARQVFRNFGKYLVEFFRMSRDINHNFIKEKVRIQHLERLRQAIERGKGVILLTGHIGNWELGGVVLSLLGYPSVAVALPHKERPVNNLFNEQRESRGLQVVPSSQAIRKCLEALRQNRVVAMLADRDFGEHGEVMDFLGRKALIPKGAAVFSGKTGAAIIPIFLCRETNDTFTLSVEEPIYPPERFEQDAYGRISREALVPIIKQYANVIERKIRENPSQWMMFRRFWIS